MRVKVSISKILYYMLSITLLIDFLNGFLPNAHIGVLFRIALIAFCAYINAVRNSKAFKICVCVVVFISINIFFSVINSGLNALKIDTSVALKSTIVYFLANALYSLYKDKPNIIDKILINNLLYGPLIFIVSQLIGLGKNSYVFSGASLGFKSMFLSLNSINAALLVLYIFTIAKAFNEKKSLAWWIASIYIMVPLLMLGTKTSIVMVVFIPILLIFINFKRTRTWKIVFLGTAILVIVIPVLWEKVFHLLESVILRQIYLFSQRDFFTYIFSTRNERVLRVFEYYWDSFSFLDIFPGRGYYGLHSAIAKFENLSIQPIEMDWADILTAYGPVGFFYTYFFAIKVIIKSWRKRFDKNIQGFLWISIILLLYGSFAGHLFLEAISSTFYAVAIAGLMINYNVIKVTDESIKAK